jgi:formylglycine-generating enzyme required for sulfatase activity
MRRFGWAALALVFLILAGSPAAQAEKRIALLIGNQGYSTAVGTLKNPFNDIAVVGDALSKQGFEVLPPIKDAKRSAMLGGVRELVRRLNAGGAGAIGFIYYSGHGAAEKDTNVNYLIPIDASAPGTSAFWDDSVKLDDVLRLLGGARSAAKFIVFDACRNELQLPTKDTSKGLVPIAEQQGMFIAYASAPGRTASDMGDKSGPYAAALAAELGHPGLDHLNFFQNVKEAVLASTGGAQQPWESNGLGRRVYLTGQPPPAATQDQLSDASREWSRADKTSIAELETFLSRHGSSAEADYARARLAPLKKQHADLAQQAAGAAKMKAEDEARAKADAERQRLAMLEQLASEARNKKKLDDEARAKSEADRQRLAMLEQLAAEAIQKQAGVRDDATPGRVFRDCSKCPEMVVVPAGSFTMGSPANEPQRGNGEDQIHATIAAPFAAGRYAVTFDEWDACIADGGCNGYKPSDQGWGRGKHPVINVNWDDAKAYAAWVSSKTGKSYRLLSEAEREYVTRAGTTTPFWWGTSITPNDANYNASGMPYGPRGFNGEYRRRTVTVDSFKANPWGLYNVHGNVWEWVEDCWNDSNDRNPADGSARTAGDCVKRVERGGSWIDIPQSLRAAHRYGYTSDGRTYELGFRLARTLKP